MTLFEDLADDLGYEDSKRMPWSLRYRPVIIYCLARSPQIIDIIEHRLALNYFSIVHYLFARLQPPTPSGFDNILSRAATLKFYFSGGDIFPCNMGTVQPKFSFLSENFL